MKTIPPYQPTTNTSYLGLMAPTILYLTTATNRNLGPILTMI